MVSTRTVLATALGVLLLAGLSFSLLAQAPGEQPGGKAEGPGGKRAEGPGGRRGEGPGGPRNFDPEQMRQRMMEGMKTALGATDEEWKAIGPKVEKVMSASREARFGGMGFGPPGGPFGGGPRGPQDPASQSPLAKASSDLRTTLDDKSASADEIGKKLTALRQTREKARDEMAKAQKELKELLTQRQEATLVMMGTLD